MTREREFKKRCCHVRRRCVQSITYLSFRNGENVRASQPLSTTLTSGCPHARTLARSISPASRRSSRIYASTPQHIQHHLELPPDNIRLHLDLAPPQYIALRKFSSKSQVSRSTGAYRLTHAGGHCILGCAAMGSISLAGEDVSRCSFPSFIPSFLLHFLLEFGWTRTHGHFAIMGAFLYKRDRDDPDVKGVFASPYHHPLKTLVRRRRIILTEADIEDRSKGDIISKGLVLLQTSWFVIQILARIDQGLPITELELATLAYAVLNFATYFFW